MLAVDHRGDLAFALDGQPVLDLMVPSLINSNGLTRTRGRRSLQLARTMRDEPASSTCRRLKEIVAEGEKLLVIDFGRVFPTLKNALPPRRHEGHEGSDIIFLNFVLFVSFVVKILFRATTSHREILVQPFLDDVGQARVFFVEGEVVDVRQQVQLRWLAGFLEHFDRLVGRRHESWRCGVPWRR
jgi:hypothetical protein